MFQVKDLLWNIDSTVLAVWLEDLAAGEDKQVNTYRELNSSCFPPSGQSGPFTSIESVPIRLSSSDVDVNGCKPFLDFILSPQNASIARLLFATENT